MIAADDEGRRLDALLFGIGTDTTPDQQTERARLRGLRNFARRIFIDRNAAGMPPAYRTTIKAMTRPHHREAIGLLRDARTALLAGNADRWELLVIKACAKLEHVQVLFRQPVLAAKGRAVHALVARSTGPRPGAKSAPRQRIVDLMRGYGRDGTEFKVFMAAWTDEKTLDDLTIELEKSGKYIVGDDRVTETVRRSYTWRTLSKMYSGG